MSQCVVVTVDQAGVPPLREPTRSQSDREEKESARSGRNDRTLLGFKM